MKLLTFGYGNDKHPRQRLFPALLENGCQVLVDVRDRPVSGFDRVQWAAKWLKSPANTAGVCSYYHMPSLGNLPLKKGGRVLPWNRPADWENGIDFLLGMIWIHGAAAIMCCEGQPFVKGLPVFGHYCHRVEIAHIANAKMRRLTGEDLEIIHLRPKGQESVVYRTQEDCNNHPIKGYRE